jgi:hypothetical protein
MAKTTVEECLVLDVFQFARKGYLTPGTTGGMTWRRGEAVFARVVSLVVEEDLVYLPLIEREGVMDYDHHGLEIVRTPGSTYGGEQVRFLCAGCLNRLLKTSAAPASGSW